MQWQSVQGNKSASSCVSVKVSGGLTLEKLTIAGITARAVIRKEELETKLTNNLRCWFSAVQASTVSDLRSSLEAGTSIDVCVSVCMCYAIEAGGSRILVFFSWLRK